MTVETTSFCRPLRTGAMGFAVAAILAACEPRIVTHGHIPDPDALARIEPGTHSQQDVMAFLGNPSSTALFGDDTWLYISMRREKIAFIRPETIEQNVTAISFDGNGMVKEVASLALQDGLPVEPVSRTTPSFGKQVGLLEQLLGNIGRFNTESQATTGIPGN